MDRDIIKNKLREGLVGAPLTLYVFDFDGTLIDTGLPETHKPIWKEKTGEEFPAKGWWGRPESLDLDIYDHQPIASVVADYKEADQDPNGLMVMLTGRRKKLSDLVEATLHKYGLKFDRYLYNYGSDTLSNKIEQMSNILSEHPSIKKVFMWEDREEHIPTFKQWGKTLIGNGRLEDMDLTHVPSPNHQ